MEHNRELVDKLSGGRLAYVYLPDTHSGGFANFNRYYYSQVGKQGAVIDERSFKRIASYLQLAKSDCRVVAGGTASDAKGWFVAPTFVETQDPRHRLMTEEIFGPVLSLLEFDSEEEVIARANDTTFGLAAGVFTNDLRRGHRVIHQLQAGTCWINNYNITPIELPFGGYRQSGIGRENSLAAIHHYTQFKSVYVEMGNVESPY